MSEMKIDGFSLEDLRKGGWTDAQIANDPKWSQLLQTENVTPPTPPPPFSEESNECISPEFSSESTPNIEDSISMENVQDMLDGSNNSPSPLEIDSYSPEGEVIIASITPADFDNVMKVLNVVTKENATDNIIIRKSKVKQGTSGCTIEADMSKILVYNGTLLDLDIINPKKYISLFSQFRTGNNIFITDDDTNSRFIVTNGEIQLFLPKQSSDVNQEVQVVDTSNSTKVCDLTIDKETRKIIKGLAKGQDYLEYLIQDGDVKAMHIPDTAIFKFESFIKDEKASKLDETNADLILRSSNFLPIDAETYNISLVQLKDDNSYVCVTTCQIGGLIDVIITEMVDNTTGGNILI